MDTKTENSLIKKVTTIPLLEHPAHLWIGSHEIIDTELIKILQKIWCNKDGCNECAICISIKSKQYHGMLWLKPDQNYLKEHLDPIFSISSFSLEHNEHFFFIIEKTDYLNAAAANVLLKVLEEPPSGYHFILLAERQDSVLATIQSRCIIKIFPARISAENKEVITWFTSLSFPDPSIFMARIEQLSLNNREVIEIMDTVMDYWLQKYSLVSINGNSSECKKIKHVVDILKQTYEQPPMPGSSKIFLKNLFIIMKSIAAL